MDDQTSIFDEPGFIADAKATLDTGQMVRPARVGFLAGMLSVWTLGPGVKPTTVEAEHFKEAARQALELAGRVAR
jgi:hypothetical protein